MLILTNLLKLIEKTAAPDHFDDRNIYFEVWALNGFTFWKLVSSSETLSVETRKLFLVLAFHQFKSEYLNNHLPATHPNESEEHDNDMTMNQRTSLFMKENLKRYMNSIICIPSLISETRDSMAPY
jgi:hypothetical protein